MVITALTALRHELARQNLDGFIVPRADEHLGEYVPAAAERLAWLTGFTGSAGLAAVLASTAAVFTDGRYVLQLAEQTDPDLWHRLHITDDPPPDWLARKRRCRRRGEGAALICTRCGQCGRRKRIRPRTSPNWSARIL